MKCSSCHYDKKVEEFTAGKKTCKKCLGYQKRYRALHKQERKRYRTVNKRNIRMMMLVHNSKNTDKKKNRYDANNHVDACWIKQEMYECEFKCYYCKTWMSLRGEAKSDGLLTIERKDNTIGHIKSNCVLACYKCNMRRGDRFSFEEFKKIIADLETV